MKDMEQLRRAAVRAGLMGMNGTSVAMHKLEAFAELLLDEENEACAQVSADTAERWSDNTGVADEITEAIRARRKA
jgi:hypothetical protein